MDNPTTQPMGMVDFFTMEAGEYLERLDAMVSPSEAPDAPELHRLARALRGSALMAAQHQVANVAGGLEALARVLREGRQTWSEAVRQLAIRAVDDLKVLVRAVRNWTPAEDARAQRIIAELEHAAGTTPPAARSEPQELDAGTRAFIAREGAAVGSALDQAAKSLARNPAGYKALDAVLRATQPLRGIASLSDLPPLPDLLDGIECAIQELSRRSEATPNPGDVFDAAARAVSRASQEIATAGQAEPDSAEAGEFARQLGVLLDMGPEIVPIERLYHADGGPHIVTQGGSAVEAPGQLEIVSLSERLRQAADELDRAQSTTQRQLRAHVLAPTFRILGSAGRWAAGFVNAARDAIARGAAVHNTQALAAQLREVGVILSDWAPGNDDALDQRLQPTAAALNALGEQPALAPAATTPATAAPPAESAPVATPAEENGLVAVLTAYQQLVATGNPTSSALAALIEGTAPAGVAPSVAPTSAPAAAPAAPAEPTEQLPPVTDYCYSGEGARERALYLKEKLRDPKHGDGRELLDEIFDLLELGR